MESTKIHPLNLPEIIASVGLFLRRGSLVTCFRVSRLWYRVLSPLLWESFACPAFFSIPTDPHLCFIQKIAPQVRELFVEYGTIVRLPESVFTFPTLAYLDIYGTDSPFDAPALASFIERHRKTLKSVTSQYATEAVLAPLHDCPRLESLSLECQGSTLDPTKWIQQFEQLWSRLRTVSLTSDSRFHLPQSAIPTAMDWPRSNGPNCIQDLKLSFNFSETISAVLTWIVKQCPDLIRLHWVHVAGNDKSPMERLADIFQGDPTFGKSLEDITLSGVNFKNAAFQSLMGSVVRLRRLNIHSTNFDQESWTVLWTTNPAHMRSLTVLNLDYCRNLPARATHQMLCELPSLKIFVATAVEDRDMVEDPRPWICLDMEEITLRLLLTSFSIEPSVRTLAIKKYLALVGQLTKLKVCKEILPSDEQGNTFYLTVKNGLDTLKNLRHLRLAPWAYTCSDEDGIRWILENWPLLENPSRSKLQTKLDRGKFC